MIAVAEHKTRHALANKQRAPSSAGQLERSVSHSERLRLQGSSIYTAEGITLQKIACFKILLYKGPPYHFLATFADSDSFRQYLGIHGSLMVGKRGVSPRCCT